jgi:hypothetical protein
VFCIYLRTNSDFCHIHHKLIGFYNREGKCLQRGTNFFSELSSLRFVFKRLNLNVLPMFLHKRFPNIEPSCISFDINAVWNLVVGHPQSVYVAEGSTVVWGTMPSLLVEIIWCFGGSCCNLKVALQSECDFIHLVVCLMTGPKRLPKRALHIVRSNNNNNKNNNTCARTMNVDYSRASSFRCECPILSLM